VAYNKGETYLPSTEDSTRITRFLALTFIISRMVRFILGAYLLLSAIRIIIFHNFQCLP
jgi:hypothetical protein